ncbi:MAG: hypothetical protein WC789_10580 [Lentisphaeria bacterium]
MCFDCWLKRGSPKFNTAEVVEAAAALREVYEHSLVGGALHVAVDDFNVEAQTVRWCLDEMDKPGQIAAFGYTPEAVAAYRRAGNLLLALPSDEHRAAAVALHFGYWRLYKIEKSAPAPGRGR